MSKPAGSKEHGELERMFTRMAAVELGRTRNAYRGAGSLVWRSLGSLALQHFSCGSLCMCVTCDTTVLSAGVTIK